MNKQLFDDAIGEVPRSTVDVDAVIARGRRAARLRSPAVAVAAGVVLLTGGVTMALLPQVRDDLRPGGMGPADRSGCYDMLPTAPPLTERPEATASRLTGVLGPLVASRLAAGSRLEKPTEHPPGESPESLVFSHSYAEPRDIGLPGDCFVGWDHFGAGADVARNGKTSAISVEVGRLGGFNSNREGCDPGSEEETYCDEQTGPNGEQIVVVTLEINGAVTHEVDLARPDGTWMYLTASSDIYRGVNGGAPTAPAPPLTREQLLEIALDPGLTLYPSD